MSEKEDADRTRAGQLNVIDSDGLEKCDKNLLFLVNAEPEQVVNINRPRGRDSANDDHDDDDEWHSGSGR